ncbi:MAG: DUF1569 domain-containing protein [Flavisolibacter sp.]
MKIDIVNRKELNAVLEGLREDSAPRWGLMKAQNMIEHLAKTLQYSNGKKQIAQRATEQEASEARARFIYTEVEMSRGLKSPLLGEMPDPFEFSSLEEAKMQLNRELDDFEAYFENHPEASFIQPRLGKMNRKEWIIFHNKHFTHHFLQFGLL